MAECRITVSPSRARPGCYDIRRTEIAAYGAAVRERATDVPASQVLRIVEDLKTKPSKQLQSLGEGGYSDITVRLPGGLDAAISNGERAPDSRDHTRATP